jgi:ppGpp synthetase/RelA/SpoT-type nucleotidyltranferase
VTTQSNKADTQKWLKAQVRAAVKELPHYRIYAKTLRTILQEAIDRYAPGGVAEGREKSLSSFAEKAMRKRDKYDDPARQITDLCGARAIVYSQSQLQAIGQFIRDNFLVDEANSDDAGARLKPSEFGYRSVHFVVQVQKRSILGVRVPLVEIGDRKAEIQVRTLLQHAWASITHDRLYKGTFKPSPKLERTSARLSALLEEAEAVVENFERDLQEYLGSYSMHLEAEKLDEEILIQRLVLNHDEPDKRTQTALKLARLCRTAGRLDAAITTLKSAQPRATNNLRLPFDLELGSLLVQHGLAKGSTKEMEDGIRRLKAVAGMPDPNAPIEISFNPEDEKLRSEAAAIVAKTSAADTTRQQESPAFFNLALQRDPSDPYHLISLFEFRPSLTEDRRVIEAARPSLLRAIDTCRRHVDAGLEIPRAWLTMGRLHLLLERPYSALDCYATAIHFYRTHSWKRNDFDAEIRFIHKLRNEGFCGACSWVEGFLQLGWAVLDGDAKEALSATKRSVLYSFERNKRVLIIAGGAADSLKVQLERYGSLLKKTLEGFEGVVVSGGTTSGIPGLVGTAAGSLCYRGKASLTLVGYHPATRPTNVELDRAHYNSLLEVKPWGRAEESVADFSASEPLQNWLDLIASGIDPAQVRVVGVNGGDISRFEYAMALAFGATVGVIESSGRQASEICLDLDWVKATNLLPLPEDSATVHAFVHLPLDLLVRHDPALEKMGRKAHDIYLRTVTKRDYRKPATLPWEYLPEDFVFSNKAQAAYAPHILERFGYKVEPARKPKSLKFPFKLIKRMAEMEHGRWNVERLLRGWRYAPKKDEILKRSPYLVSWKALPDEIREYDLKAVRNFPEILAAGGYEIVKR